MGQGLRVWNGSGQLILDTSTFVGRFKGIINIGANQQGSFSVPRENGELVFATLTLTNDMTVGAAAYTYIGTSSNSNDNTGNVVYYQTPPNNPGYIVYGVF